jgi:predicted CXXCH cytochrome family protein
MKSQTALGMVMVALVSLLGAAASLSSAAESKYTIPEYIGSQACLGCHPAKYSAWKPSNHATMVVEIINSTGLPLDIAKAPANLQAELRKATHIVARSFLMARDPETQHYKMLNVIYDPAGKAYRASNFSLDWSTQCAGCHTTNMNTGENTWGEAGIGCEACHGPGRDHAIGKGDKTKIVSSKDSDICGQCHGGNDVQTGGRMMADGTKWVVGYRPGMKLSEVPGLQLTPVDSKKIPPDSNVTANHLRNYNMWAASGHGKALGAISKNDKAAADCYGCHSAEGFLAKLEGRTIDLTDKQKFNTLSCVTCHEPHNSDNPRQLVMEPEKLCSSCHTQEATLKGRGATGIEETKGVHSGITCIQCHMTEGNHLMHVIRPDDADLKESRADSCTSCHKDSNKKTQAAFLQEWQASFTKSMDGLQSDLKIIGASLKTNPDLLNPDLKKLLDTTRGNLSIISRDGSRGAHNIAFATRIMNQARTDLDLIKASMR